MLDERKKIMIMGGLFVVVIAVGAFQLRPSGPPPAPKAPASVTAFASKLAANKPAQVTSALSSPTKTGGSLPVPASSAVTASYTPDAEPPLPQRDPFLAPLGSDATPSKIAPTLAQKTNPASSGRVVGAVPPLSIPGTIMKDSPGLPIPGGAAPSGPISKEPAANTPKVEPTFNWRLIGVVTGEHPVAIFADATGNQRMIRAGGSIDPDSHLVSVGRNSATLDFRGKTLQLSLEGDPHAK